MRAFLAAFILIACAPVFCEAARFPLRGAALQQRGVLRAGGAETAVNFYISGGETIRARLANDFGALASAEIGAAGNVLSCRGGAFMSDADAEKFFLRPLLLSLGFYARFAPEIAHTCADSQGYALAVALPSEGLYAEFSYGDFGGKRLPAGALVRSPKFELELKTVKVFSKK